MKMDIDVWDMKRVFTDLDRDYWSMNGLDTLLEYYNEIDENMEFDPIAICCDFTEYGRHGAVCSFEDLVNDYGYILDRQEWEDERGYGFVDDHEGHDDEYLKALIEALEDKTTVLHPVNGNVIVAIF